MKRKTPQQPKPPTPVKREPRACHDFLAKLESRIPHGDLLRTFEQLGIARNQLHRWREGKPVRLDYAFLLARKIGVSLDWLADDGLAILSPAAEPRTGPAAGLSERPQEMEPTTSTDETPRTAKASAAKRKLSAKS